MATRDFIPRREGDLMPWGANLVAIVATDYALLGLTEADATELGTLYGDFDSAWRTARDPLTRGDATIYAKGLLKARFIALVRKLVGIIQKNPAVTNQQRLALGITIPKQRAPVPPPAVTPTVDVVSVSGRTVRLTVHDGTDLRAKPDGVAEAWIYSAIGENAPEAEEAWRLIGIATRNRKSVRIVEATAGQKVWLRARWANAKAQAGPMGAAVSTAMQLSAAPPVSGVEGDGTSLSLVRKAA